MHHRLIAAMLSASSAGGGGGGGTLWDDEFNTGSALDTAGTRFASAKPWTKQNFGTSTDSVGSDQLTITTQASANLQDPRIATQAVPAGTAWKFRLSCQSLSTNANYNGLGMVLRESGTGKLLCYGLVRDAAVEQLQTRRQTGYTTWAANYNLIATSSPFYTDDLEIERSGSSLIFRRYESGAWFTRQTIAVTDDFTTEPDQIGLWANGPTSTSAVAVFNWWRRAS